MDVYPAQKAICVMEEQIRSNPYQFLIIMVKFARKVIIVLKAPKILYPVHLVLSMQFKVLEHYSNAQCAK